MPRIWTLNPFKNFDVSDFPDVLVPLQQATRHHSIVSTKKDDDKASDAASVSTEPGLTIESLKAEIEGDVAAGGMDTAYDRTFYLLDKLIL